LHFSHRSGVGVHYYKTKQIMIIVNSQNNNKMIQSAGNPTGSSETIRQLSNNNNDWFGPWFAGVIDGDGNFDFRNVNGKPVLKSIRIKFHIRDVKILNVIQNQFHFGVVRYDKNKPYCVYTISIRKHMACAVHLINGLIRLKISGFVKACDCLAIPYVEADYVLKQNILILLG
jgi:hypothetical protein